MPLSQAAPGESSTVTRNYRHMRGQEFFVLTRRERRAYPSAVCKERATPSARKRTAALWVAPHWAWGVVAPQSQSAGGYAPSSRLAPGQMRRNACIDNSLSQYKSLGRRWQRLRVFVSRRLIRMTHLGCRESSGLILPPMVLLPNLAGALV